MVLCMILVTQSGNTNWICKEEEAMIVASESSLLVRKYDVQFG